MAAKCTGTKACSHFGPSRLGAARRGCQITLSSTGLVHVPYAHPYLRFVFWMVNKVSCVQHKETCISQCGKRHDRLSIVACEASLAPSGQAARMAPNSTLQYKRRTQRASRAPVPSLLCNFVTGDKGGKERKRERERERERDQSSCMFHQSSCMFHELGDFCDTLNANDLIGRHWSAFQLFEAVGEDNIASSTALSRLGLPSDIAGQPNSSLAPHTLEE